MRGLIQLINQFNQPDIHLVVSQWPEEGVPYHGVAAFTRETLLTLAKNEGMRFVVLAETGLNNEPKLLARGQILLLRVFNHQHPTLYPTILTWLTKFSKIRTITVHSEFGSLKGLSHFVLLIPFLSLIRLANRRVVFFSHNVVASIDFIAEQFNVTNKPVKILLNVGVNIYNKLLSFIANNIITLDTQSYQTLAQICSETKLHLFPHWVKPRIKPLGKKAARRLLGIPVKSKVILAFGFISWYKGTDLLAKMFSDATNTKNYFLLFAGGEHVNIKRSPHYQAYYNEVKQTVSQKPNMKITGFLSQQDVALAFTAADLVVLPYRGLMGGSGALSYAIGFSKPWMVSKQMTALFQNKDIRESLKQTEINKNNLIFTTDSGGLNKIFTTVNNRKLLRRMTKLSLALRKERDIEANCRKLYLEVYERDNQIAPKIAIATA